MTNDVQVSMPMLKVLRVMVDQPLKQMYGLELMKAAEIKSGTLYPLLARLTQAGWLEAEWEQHDPDAGRPPRKFYRLSKDGMARARTTLAEAHAATAPAKPLRASRPVPGATS
jgi:DNA-binding PadR family transcriptional regulator